MPAQRTNTRRCEHCSRALRPIGYSRLNGKDHADWDTRTLHKKCWLELKKEEEEEEEEEEEDM
jgi:hypothetical protein